MPTWVALLRGINVSGQKPVPMERLRGSFASMGFRGVRTYVQSGNVVFETATNTRDALTRKIEEGISRDFGFYVVVILRTAKELEKIVKTNPFLTEEAIDQAKLHVTFLAAPPNKTALKNLETLPTSPDQFRLIGCEIYLYCPDGYGKTKLSNSAFDKKLSVGATTRNWKTTTVLCEMAVDEKRVPFGSVGSIPSARQCAEKLIIKG
jgi:uncharacterized protein (DUF1697 family)